MRKFVWWKTALLVALACSNGWCGDSDSLTKTRPEMKKVIEGLKNRQSRLPLPDLSAEEVAAGRQSVNNGRLRSIYMPASWQTNNNARPATTGATPRQAEQQRMNQMTSAPDYPFKTRLFWIVSRTNDCQYCLGHQELKLARAGMTEDQIAALDSKWSVFPEPEQAAIKFARKLTLTPHLMNDDDIQAMKKHYKDAQIIDILQSVAGNNSTNRWTASTGIPQDKSFNSDEPSKLDTPTSKEFESEPTKVAPFDYKPRPKWEPRSAVEAAIAACQQRSAAVNLPSVQVARQVLTADTPGTTPPVWFQAMCDNPQSALRVWKLRQAIARDGKLNPNLKAMIAWVTARENRAWYAAAHAQMRANALGINDDKLFAIGENEEGFTPAEQATFAFVRKLTSAPHTIVDDDVAGLRKSFSDNEVAEIIFLTCDGNMFDRFTEILRLPLEGGATKVSQLP